MDGEAWRTLAAVVSAGAALTLLPLLFVKTWLEIGKLLRERAAAREADRERTGDALQRSLADRKRLDARIWRLEWLWRLLIVVTIGLLIFAVLWQPTMAFGWWLKWINVVITCGVLLYGVVGKLIRSRRRDSTARAWARAVSYDD